MGAIERFAIAFVVFGCAHGSASPTESNSPVRTPLSEHVEVRLVTIDVLALDPKERTVPNLKATDFDLSVDGQSTKIDTFEELCDDGARPEPVFDRKQAPIDEREGSQPARQIVLAFDYLHLPYLPCPGAGGPCLLHTKTLQDVRSTLLSAAGPSDRVMVVALTGGLRVEQSFTADRETTLRTLKRMEYDVTLWAGHFEHLTEKPFFRSLDALMDTLRDVQGSKAVVLFSGGTGPGDRYTSDIQALAAKAGDARVSIYPVDCQGLYAFRPYT